jgi:16S rRNA (cytosine967-C5)-methyltransferase
MRAPRTQRSKGYTGSQARRVAVEALLRIDEEGAYANLVLPHVLARYPGMNDRDRRLVTELVYGTTRMRRACDFAVDRFIIEAPEPEARALLRLGAYQLLFTDIPPYAALSATVAVAPPRVRGFVNAVLRRCVQPGGKLPITWPDEATRLSYPDWIFGLLVAEHGHDEAVAAMEAMNEAPTVTTRADGYVQDLASQWVADAVAVEPGTRVLDACAAPGGKATMLAGRGGSVVAVDLRPHRARLISANSDRVGVADRVQVVVADACHPPFANGNAASPPFDRILVDAPCSGLGALRRRPDARWRIDAGDVDRLAGLQREILDAVVPLLGPGNELIYSVCTMTRAETTAVDDWLAAEHPELESVGGPPPGGPWRPWGRGWLLLPHDAGTDGMFFLRLTSAPR